MRAFWVQIVTLSLYFEIVFVVSRLWDLVIWFQQGAPPTEVVDPLLLSVKQLKQLLDSRGVNYTGLLEKTELAQLVSDTAVVVNSEVEYLAQTSQNSIIPLQKSSYFTSRGHFYEEVEDSRDSVWLIQVVTNNEPILDDYNWRVVCSQVEPFAIRTGVFDCRVDPRFCDSKGWKQSLLLLAMPKGTKPKDKVILRTFVSKKPRRIMDWIRHQLSVWVKKVKDTEEVTKDWLHLRDESAPETVRSSDNSSKTVQVLLITHLFQPPLFLVALSIKFSGRVRFGMLNVRKEQSDEVRRQLKFPVKSFPCYLVITPEQTVVYGKQRLEHFNFWSLNIFLRSVQPEMNDVFVGSLVLVNMLVILQSLQVFAERKWRFAAKCVWIFMVHNLMLFSTWLIVLGGGRFKLTSLLVDKLLVLVRIVSLSTCGGLIRADWCSILQYPLLCIISFLVFAFIVAVLLPSDQVAERQHWWEVFPNDSYWVNCLFGNMGSLSHSVQLSLDDTDFGMQEFVERLPNVWLQPTVPVDYIADLPVWRYRPTTNTDPSSNCSCPVPNSFCPKEDRRVCDKCRGLSLCRRRNISLADCENYSSVSEESDGEDFSWAAPPWVLTTTMCAICLETYHAGTRMCALPCGHNYHHRCISVWIMKEHHHCPICRWPAYRSRVSVPSRNLRLD